MTKLTTLQCPRCGAQVEIEPRADRGTCTYCGTIAHVKAAAPAAPAPAARSPRRAVLAAVGALVMLLAGQLVWRLTMAPDAPPAALPSPPRVPEQLVPQVEAARKTPPPVPTPPPPVVRALGHTAARLVDADGDKLDELLLPIEVREGASTTSHYGVFRTRDGELLEKTPPLEDMGASTLSAVAYGRLVLAQSNGQLTGFDLASGDLQWSTALGERVAALCRADKKSSDALHVVTDDDRNLLVDVKTGRQSETRARCLVPLAVSMGRHAPSDRRDYRAPLDTEAFRCGGVRVMGSQSYSVPDACRTRFKLDTDRLQGMVGHSVWRTPLGLLIIGVRSPGTYVPMVGLHARGSWVWKSEAPAANPLDAQTGSSRFVSLHEEQLLVSYHDDKSRTDWITSFALRDGRRVWSYALPATLGGLVAVLQNDDVVVVHGERGAQLLSPQTGALVATLGNADK